MTARPLIVIGFSVLLLGLLGYFLIAPTLSELSGRNREAADRSAADAVVTPHPPAPVPHRRSVVPNALPDARDDRVLRVFASYDDVAPAAHVPIGWRGVLVGRTDTDGCLAVRPGKVDRSTTHAEDEALSVLVPGLEHIQFDVTNSSATVCLPPLARLLLVAPKVLEGIPLAATLDVDSSHRSLVSKLSRGYDKDRQSLGDPQTYLGQDSFVLAEWWIPADATYHATAVLAVNPVGTCRGVASGKVGETYSNSLSLTHSLACGRLVEQGVPVGSTRLSYTYAPEERPSAWMPTASGNGGRFAVPAPTGAGHDPAELVLLTLDGSLRMATVWVLHPTDVGIVELGDVEMAPVESGIKAAVQGNDGRPLADVRFRIYAAEVTARDGWRQMGLEEVGSTETSTGQYDIRVFGAPDKLKVIAEARGYSESASQECRLGTHVSFTLQKNVDVRMRADTPGYSTLIPTLRQGDIVEAPWVRPSQLGEVWRWPTVAPGQYVLRVSLLGKPKSVISEQPVTIAAEDSDHGIMWIECPEIDVPEAEVVLHEDVAPDQVNDALESAGIDKSMIFLRDREQVWHGVEFDGERSTVVRLVSAREGYVLIPGYAPRLVMLNPRKRTVVKPQPATRLSVQLPSGAQDRLIKVERASSTIRLRLPGQGSEFASWPGTAPRIARSGLAEFLLPGPGEYLVSLPEWRGRSAITLDPVRVRPGERQRRIVVPADRDRSDSGR